MEILGICIIGIVILFCVVVWYSNEYLLVREYEYVSSKVPKKLDGVRILHISDIHSKRIGKKNCVLINKINEINPDYIFMTGDIIDKREKNIEKVAYELKPIFNEYKVYYSMGNHERRLGYKNYCKYIEILEKFGVNILKDSNMSLDGIESVNIVGLNFKDNIRHEEKNPKRLDRNLNYLKSKAGQICRDKLNILLAHDSLNFELYNKLGFDLIFSGHLHGGIIRFFNIGLLSTRRKLFPKYCHGKYIKNNSTMFVSSGIGKATAPIRLFNNPEISVIILKNK